MSFATAACTVASRLFQAALTLAIPRPLLQSILLPMEAVSIQAWQSGQVQASPPYFPLFFELPPELQVHILRCVISTPVDFLTVSRTSRRCAEVCRLLASRTRMRFARVVTTYYKNNPQQVKETRRLLPRGWLHGKLEAWHENGQKAKECAYRDGKKDGIHEEWHSNGQRAQLCTYRVGKAEGRYEMWYENGQRHFQCTYREGKQEGRLRMWCENGQKHRECSFRNGKKEGKYTEWYPDGTKRAEHNYHEDKLEGSTSYGTETD